MRVALVQIDPYIGDFSGNAKKICDFIARARSERCDLAVFPEMALIGYPPRDLLDKPSFMRASKEYWPQIREASSGIGVVCGAVSENESVPGKPFHNTALFFADGKLVTHFHKRLLPSYDVFDEERYFEPGDCTGWIDFRGERLGLTVCEDIWNVADYLPAAALPLRSHERTAEGRGRGPDQYLRISLSCGQGVLGERAPANPGGALEDAGDLCEPGRRQ